MKGKVIATIGGVYDVYLENKQLVKVSPKGILKHKKKSLKLFLDFTLYIIL